MYKQMNHQVENMYMKVEHFVTKGEITSTQHIRTIIKRAKTKRQGDNGLTIAAKT